MNIPLRKKALIITQRIVAGHQIACILENHGWSSVSTHNTMKLSDVSRQCPGMLVIDVTDPQNGNLNLLHTFSRTSNMAYLVALCEGGNTPTMRAARRIGVDGFFYLNRANQALDPTRGLAPLFSNSRVAATQPRAIPASLLSNHFSTGLALD